MSLETRLPGARRALALLLAINLFNFIDRYILAALEPEIRKALFAADDPDAMGKTGLLATAFLVSYMVTAPIFGWLADRYPRWMLVGIGVALWSLASGASGLAATFVGLLITRVFVGVGEAAYGPSAPTLLADYFPQASRGRVLSLFYLAIPVGSALGYVFAGAVGPAWGWRWAFYLVTPPGLLLAAFCVFMPDPRKLLARARAIPCGCGCAAPEEEQPAAPSFRQGLLGLLRNRSFLSNTSAMTAMTFAMGGLSFWVPCYIQEYRHQPDPGHIKMLFGAITVTAGLISTLLGGWLADRLKRRHPGAYFLVSGYGSLIAFPLTVAMLYTPFPAFVIHALGDAISPPLIGRIADRWQMNVAFLTVSGMIAIAGLLWLRGARYLESDTKAAGDFTES